MRSPGIDPEKPGSREPRAALSYQNGGFVESDDARPLRILAEYLQPLHRLRQQRIHDTVAFFGSARINAEGPLGRYYHEARELARLLTAWSNTLTGHRRFVVDIPIILYGSSYWNEIIDFEAMVRYGVIDRNDLALFSFADHPQDALGILQARLPTEREPTTPAFAKSRTPPNEGPP